MQRLMQVSFFLRPVKRDLFEGWIDCMLGLAAMSARRKRECKKKTEAGGGRYCTMMLVNKLDLGDIEKF